jgi:DNA-binding NarL/FixJ family response regulator
VQVLSLVSRGRSNREVAQTLQITEKTVKHYMTSIFEKLEVRNRVEAVVKARGLRVALEERVPAN